MEELSAGSEGAAGDGGVMEELSAGEDPESPRRWSLWVWVLIGVVVLAVGAVASGLVGSSPSSAPAVAPTASPSPRVFITTRPGPLSYLDAGNLCEPRTYGRRMLAVSFELNNVGGVAVDVLDVSPTLPLAGLTPVGPVRSGGSCSSPGKEPARQTIPVSESRVYTMTLRLPRQCPAPYPVQASYRIEVNGQQMTATLPLYPDLSDLPFTSCAPE